MCEGKRRGRGRSPLTSVVWRKLYSGAWSKTNVYTHTHTHKHTHTHTHTYSHTHTHTHTHKHIHTHSLTHTHTHTHTVKPIPPSSYWRVCLNARQLRRSSLQLKLCQRNLTSSQHSAPGRQRGFPYTSCCSIIQSG